MAESANPPSRETGTSLVKRGLAEMLKGGVIMDVVNPEQAKIAEDAGAVAVMALERVPSDIRRDGGVSRMSDPEMIEAAYRRLARRYHPDLNKSPEAAEMMRRLNEAKETLMNAATRRQYDATRGVGWGNWSKPQGSYAAGNGASGGAYQNSSSGLPSLQMIRGLGRVTDCWKLPKDIAHFMRRSTLSESPAGTARVPRELM